MAKPPSRRSTSTEIAQFLQTSKTIATVTQSSARIIFAIDATASREPTWASARKRQQSMFQATREIAALSVQLCYYRGFHEFYASQWLADSEALFRLMGGVACEGGHTQIARVLKHAIQQHRQTPVKAVVFIGDALEEDRDGLANLAGQCGMLKLPLFIFQEGRDARVSRSFEQFAKLSGGAFARFDNHSAQLLAELLGAVASFAAGGRDALEQTNNAGAKLLLEQLKC